MTDNTPQDWSTPEGQSAIRPIHCYPLNDTRGHVTSGDPCPCMPRVRHAKPVQEDDGSWSQPDASHDVVLHNSYDGREVGEVGRLALDLLACALSDYGHEWTDAERDAYEHAIDVLNAHWPPKPSEKPCKRMR